MSDSASVAYFFHGNRRGPGSPHLLGRPGCPGEATCSAPPDLALPVVGVSLLHRAGYFDQSIDASGMQHESRCAGTRQ